MQGLVCLLVLYLVLQRCSAATIVTNTLEKGETRVTCSAQNVKDMRWTVHSIPIHIYEFVDFSTILRSAAQNEVIIPGITLSSVVVQGQFYGIYSSVQSNITASPSLKRQGDINFVCSGHILDDDDNFYDYFSEQAEIVPNDDDEDYPFFPHIPKLYPSSATYPQDPGQSDAPMTTGLGPQPTNDPTPFTTDPIAPGEGSPMTPAQHPNYNEEEETEMDNVNITPRFSTLPPNPNSRDSESTTVPIGIWIGAAILAVVITVFVVITILVCCIVVKSKTPNECLPATEEAHHYDSIDSHRVLTQGAQETPPLNVPAASHRLAEEYNERGSVYIQMAPRSASEQPLQTLPETLERQVSLDETGPYYTSIKDSIPCASVTPTGSDGKIHLITNSIEMTSNVAYPAVNECFEDSGGYI